MKLLLDTVKPSSVNNSHVKISSFFDWLPKQHRYWITQASSNEPLMLMYSSMHECCIAD